MADLVDHTPFVGRQQELATLLRCLGAAGRGQGQIVLVTGEPGIGKTRLLAELGEHARGEGWQVLVGHAYDSEGMPPYLPFSEALRDYVRAAPIDDLRAQLDEAGPEVALLAPDVRRRFPDLATVATAAPEEQRYRLFESVADFLIGIPRRSEARGLVLILDDLHWAEQSSIILLQHLARRLTGAPLLVVGAYRTVDVSINPPLAALLVEQRRADVCQWVQLAPLTVEEVGALVEEVAGGAPPASVVEAIARQTEGNPFFVGEVIRNLLSEGRDLTIAEAATAVAGVPAGIREVINRRLERLSAPANSLLRVGAVLGDGFRFEALQAALAYPLLPRRVGSGEGTALLDALDEALAAGTLREAGGNYRFSHALIHRTIYDDLSLARRQHLHQQIAHALEQQYTGRLGDHDAELAEHFARSTDPADLAKAVSYAELAAQRALTVYAYAEAARHLEQALQAQRTWDPGDRAKLCDLLLALGELLLPAGQPLRAAEAIAPEALALAEILGDEERAARACWLARLGLTRYGRSAMWATPAWRHWAERADHHAAPGTVHRARADMFLAMLRIQEGRIGEGRALLLRALSLARALSDAETVLGVTQSLLSWGRSEDAEEQRRLAEEVEKWPRDRLSPALLSGVLWGCGITFLEHGERARAEALWCEVAELAVRTRDPSQGSLVRDIWLATLDGEIEAAVSLGLRALAQADEAGMPIAGLLFVSAATCRPLLYLGRGEEALAALIETSARAGAENPKHAGLASLCLAHLGRLSEAREMLSQFLTELGTGPAAEDGLAFALMTWLETAVLVEDRHAAAILARRLAPMASLASGSPAIVPTCIARYLGAASALMGDRAAALRYSEQALVFARRIRHRPEVALGRLHLAELMLGERERALPDTRAAALEHLNLAIAELAAMKMLPALTRARALESIIRMSHSSTSQAAYPDGLSGRQVEVLCHLADGRSNREIADLLVVSERTVEHHIADIYRKIGAGGRSGRFAAAAYARSHNLRTTSPADTT